MAQNNEASVEEILESIKKVIARDNQSAGRHDAGQTRQQRKPAAPDADPQSDSNVEEVLELDNMLAEDDHETDLDGASEAMSASDDNSDTGGEAGEDAPLLGADVHGAMKENLAALAMLAEPGARPQIVRSGETSLEGLTRELMRPMLAEWLDKNLPGMVEKMVQAEIARIAGKRR